MLPVQIGLASVASQLQAVGGTASVDTDSWVEQLESIAASIESGTTPQATALTFECLPQDLPTILGLLSDVLQCASLNLSAPDILLPTSGWAASVNSSILPTVRSSCYHEDVPRMQEALHCAANLAFCCTSIDHTSTSRLCTASSQAHQYTRPSCRQPALPERKLQLLRAQIEDSIEHRNDSKGAVASRKVKQLLYGQGSLYSREPAQDDVKALTRDAVQQWLAKQQRAHFVLLSMGACMQSVHPSWLAAALQASASGGTLLSVCLRSPVLARCMPPRAPRTPASSLAVLPAPKNSSPLCTPTSCQQTPQLQAPTLRASPSSAPSRRTQSCSSSKTPSAAGTWRPASRRSRQGCL